MKVNPIVKKNLKIKKGRPPSNKDPIGKYTIVYEAIPDDGQHIRYNDLRNKLYPMNKQTLSAALKFGIMIGIIGQERHSHKHVEYYKLATKTILPIEQIEQTIIEMDKVGMSEMEKDAFFLSNIRPSARHELLKKLKTGGDPKAFDRTQAIFIKDSMSFIETYIRLALMKYADTPNKTTACDIYINTIQFIIAPLLKKLPEYINDMGLSDTVKLALQKSRSRRLQESDFVDADEINKTIDFFKNTDAQDLQNLFFGVPSIDKIKRTQNTLKNR